MQKTLMLSPTFWLSILTICALSLLASDVRSQTPTPEQIEIFQNLPPDQQQAIIEAMGKSGGGMSGTSSSGRTRTDRQVKFPDVVRRGSRQQGEDQEQLDAFGNAREPRIKPQDTILLSLELKEFKGQESVAPPVPNFAVPVGASPGVTGVAQQAGPQQAQAQPTSSPEKIERTEQEQKRLDDFRTRVLRRNPLQLDKWGILNVPELGTIPLAGLTAEEATQRLAAEPLLSDFVVKVTYLPVKPIGAQALKPFGYDLFEGSPTTFAPATDVPVPAEYIVGPGDVLEVQLFGSTKGRYSLIVGRDGQINFPELGPIAVSGMKFDDARATVAERVNQQFIGTQVSVQMGELRSIRVFVLGDANEPGSYTVSGLSTITNALFVSGGVKRIGSLRNIELKRSGRTVSKLDLYDLLLKGDTSGDVRLLPGDVIFIPPVGSFVGVSGEVRRPALYELKGESTAADLIRLGGGLTAEADAALASMERVDAERRRVVVDVNLETAGNARLKNGDILRVPAVRATVQDAVVLNGHVHRPGEFQYRPGMRIGDVLPSLDELKQNADQQYVLIRREVPPSRKIEFVSVDLQKALEQRGTNADVELAPRDQIFVFDRETGRARLMEPLLREAKLQASLAEPTKQVSIGGRANAPGDYPLERNMRVSDLVRAGGSLNEAAYGGKAELTRYDADGGEIRKTELIEIDLAKAVAGDLSANVELRPFDYLVIKELPLWGAQEYVEVKGEVRFPGRYPIQRGETLHSLVSRAGGLTEFAFPQGAVFTRESLKEREREQLENLTKRMQSDLAQVSLMTAQEGKGDAAQALAVGKELLSDLQETNPVGRLVINLSDSVKATPGSTEDVVLKDGDQLMVPRVTQEVTVLGEVQSP
ncbi:MAG TPA: SLBB domain-containing protein, partial [Paraburkholderia sp.]|uniref:SLBB domain-containing protein n=1 Tax=Paraburkholderia sp. TaxID=1926495 RepID=UPI002B49D037